MPDQLGQNIRIWRARSWCVHTRRSASKKLLVSEFMKVLLIETIETRFFGKKFNFFVFFNYCSQEPRKSGAMFSIMLRFRMDHLNINFRTKYAQRHQPSCWHIWKVFFAGQWPRKLVLAAQVHHLSNAKTHQGNQRLSYVSVLSPRIISPIIF